MKDRNWVVDVLIPTYKPDKNFITNIQRLQEQEYPVHKIIIMNTEERFWRESGVESRLECSHLEIHHVTANEFDHGGTRHQGMEYSKADIVICMTQDALPKDQHLVTRLLEGLAQPGAAVAYARQLPYKDCGILEAYTRGFNYPDANRVKTIKDLPELGIKTYFCSNVCAAYKRNVYLELGGFTRRTIFNEDMIFAGKAIQAGYGAVYCAKAQVFHSHNYSCVQQFRRNFDLAVSQADHPEVFRGIPSEREGLRMVTQSGRYLCRIKKPYLIPQLLVVSGFKLIGYQMGKRYKRLPGWLVMKCTMNQTYWR